MRSLWKGIYRAPAIINKTNLNKIIYLRKAVIPTNFLGKRIKIHNGKKGVSILVKEFMLNRRFGEFVVTKKLGPKIHIRIKNKKKLKKK